MRLRSILRRRRRRPTLVSPVPEIGPRPEDLRRVRFHELEGIRQEFAAALIDDDDFLWPPREERKGLNLSTTAPSHAEWAQRYNEVKDGRITYDAERTQTRLMQHISTERGEPVQRFVIAEPIRDKKEN